MFLWNESNIALPKNRTLGDLLNCKANNAKTSNNKLIHPCCFGSCLHIFHCVYMDEYCRRRKSRCGENELMKHKAEKDFKGTSYFYSQRWGRGEEKGKGDDIFA